MRPSGALMIEHRLIEKFIKIASGIIDKTNSNRSLDPVFIDTVVDFFRTYADRTHHGKEEDILFKRLEKVKMAPEHARIMSELIEEHVQARKHVGRIVELNGLYRKYDKNALAGIVEEVKFLAGFYPVHIEKEDVVFFPAAMKYFSKQEIDKMLADFWEFDRKMIHEKYEKIVNSFTV